MCGLEQFKGYKTPMAEEYHAELDTSPLLDAEGISKYKSLVGTAVWTILLGRFDIAFATGNLSGYAAAPREGHMKAMYRVFGYLQTFPNGRTLIDTSYFDRSKYPAKRESTWGELYPDTEEELPHNAPTPKGKEVQITLLVDADHARDTVTRRSVTGYLILLNNTVVASFSKKQKTVETSTYGSELVAARIAVEAIMAMRYTLRMLGVKVEKTSYMLGDNMSVLLNTTIPSSMLKKKHQGCAYHHV